MGLFVAFWGGIYRRKVVSISWELNFEIPSRSALRGYARNTKHEIRTTQHEEQNLEPEIETRIPRPEARNPKPETRNPKPETRNLHLENCYPRPQTQPKTVTRDPETGARNLQPVRERAG